MLGFLDFKGKTLEIVILQGNDITIILFIRKIIMMMITIKIIFIIIIIIINMKYHVVSQCMRTFI